MSVDDTAGGDAVVVQQRAAGQVLHRQPLDISQGLFGDHGTDVPSQLRKILLPAVPEHLRRRLGVHDGPAVGMGVETRQHLSDRHQPFPHRHPAGNERGQPLGVRISADDDNRFGLAHGRVELAHPEVARRCQPTVELHLTVAGLGAFGGGAEVEEIRAQGLLDFEGPVADEGDQSGVSFVDFGTEVARRHPRRL